MKIREASASGFAAFAVLLVFLSGCASSYFRDAGAPPLPPPRYSLADLPQPEYWTGIVFNGVKVGFSHSRVTRAAQQGLYELHGEAVIRFRFLGLEKRVQMRSLDTVDENAKLARFDYHYVLDDSEQRVTGEVRDGRLGYQVATARRPPEGKEEMLREPLYPSGALSLLPVLHGLRIGSEFRWLVFNGETQSLDRASQRIEAYEESEFFQGAAFKVRTDLLGLRSTTWIDARGRPVFELGLNGVIISALEDERTAKGYLASAAVNKDDVLVQWSLIKSPLSLSDPQKARFLRVTVNRSPPSDERQRCRAAAAEVVCEIEAARTAALSVGSADADLRPSATVQSHDPMIRSLALEITARRESVPEKIAAVLDWLERNIRKEPVDTFSALDVLDAKRGECQGHSYLYAALMRTLGVPTRVVNGLVYSAEHSGFLYHTWAESLVEGSWRAVDPTFNQTQADATHIALVRGESLSELVPLVDWVGNTRINVLEAR
jgi:transglutaminase-like putative cysteine protease